MEKSFIIKCKSGAIRIVDKYLSGESMKSRTVIAIILPLLVDQAFIVFMSLLNTVMISNSGEAAVSAVNMIDSINIFLLNIFIAIATGGTVVVAQFKGIENNQAAAKAGTQTLSAVGMVSLLISLLMIAFHTPILKLLFSGAEEAVFVNARVYLIGSCITYPFIALVEAVSGALRGAGDTKPSLWLSLITNGTYVVLNLLFVTSMQMGVSGLVISLFISRLFGMICSLIYYIKINKALLFKIKELIHFDFIIMKKILYIGVPFAAEQMFFNGGKLLTQTFIVQLGTHALFVNAVGNSLMSLLQIGGTSCNLSIVTVVGQCIGRGDIKDARKFIRSFTLLSILFFILSDIILLPLLPVLVHLFSPPTEIVSTIYTIMWMCSLTATFVWPLSFLTPSALRAAGDSRFTSVSSLFTMWMIRVILGYILGITLQIGIIGVWAAMIFEWCIRGIIFQIRLHGNRWYKHHLVD